MTTERPAVQGDEARGGARVEASLYLHPQTLARLSSIQLRAKMIVEGLSSGTHRSPFHGLSVEFAQHRPYVAGDDIRHLDWKVYGRSDKFQLKQYQQETNLDLMVLVDASGSMSYGSRLFSDASGQGLATSPDGRYFWSKHDHATALAAALSYVTLRQSDRVGLVVYSEDVTHTLRRTGSQNIWRRIVQMLAENPAQGLPSPDSRADADGWGVTKLGRAVEQMLAQVSNRCLVAIISDFFEDLGEVRAALARLKHARHDAIAFQVLDKAELEFAFRDEVPFEGLEGEGRLRLDPRALREAYLEQMRLHNEQLQRMLRGLGFDYQLVVTHDWLGPPLAAFAARRNARLRRS